MRTQAREAVLKLLFSKLFDNEADADFKKNIYNELKLDEDDKSFAEKLYTLSFNNFEEYSNRLGELSTGYSQQRIFKVDKCAMVIAMTEMNFFNDIPKVVSIDEAVKLVKKYSTESSVNFVNGILANYKNGFEVTKVD